MDQFEPKTDHDLLISMYSEMKNMRKDIRDLGEGISSKVNDHETRIRDLEKIAETVKTLSEKNEKLEEEMVEQKKTTDNLNIKMVIGVAVASFLMTFVSALILAYIKKQLGI